CVGSFAVFAGHDGVSVFRTKANSGGRAGSRRRVLSTEYSVRSTRYGVLGTECSVRSTQYSVSCRLRRLGIGREAERRDGRMRSEMRKPGGWTPSRDRPQPEEFNFSKCRCGALGGNKSAWAE